MDATPAPTVDDWIRDFDADGIFLSTPAYGLPPRATVDALDDVVQRWSRGRIDGAEFENDVERACASYARLVGVDASWVAPGPQTSPLVGLIAASLPDDADVLVPIGDFSSLTWPFTVHADRGVRVVTAPLSELADRIHDGTTLVALSSVQSLSGAMASIEDIEAAAARHDADLLVDTTQAVGWLPTDASRYAYTVCSAYKWLLSPRGTAFLTVRPDRQQRIRPLFANFSAGAGTPDANMYVLPPNLAPDARRFSVSPAWFSWLGTRTSLEYLEGIGVDALHRHARTVANAFTRAAGLEPTPGAFMALQTDQATLDLLADERVAVTVRAGLVRIAFHLYNTVEQATFVGGLLRGRVH